MSFRIAEETDNKNRDQGQNDGQPKNAEKRCKDRENQGYDDKGETFAGNNTIMFHKVFFLSSNEVLLIYELVPLVNKSLPLNSLLSA